MPIESFVLRADHLIENGAHVNILDKDRNNAGHLVKDMNKEKSLMGDVYRYLLQRPEYRSTEQ